MYFRELVDAECYPLAYEFVCQLLQPSCVRDQMVLPCRTFCREFRANCKNRLPERFKNKLDCSKFPVYQGKGTCISKPGRVCSHISCSCSSSCFQQRYVWLSILPETAFCLQTHPFHFSYKVKGILLTSRHSLCWKKPSWVEINTNSMRWDPGDMRDVENSHFRSMNRGLHVKSNMRIGLVERRPMSRFTFFFYDIDFVFNIRCSMKNSKSKLACGY